MNFSIYCHLSSYAFDVEEFSEERKCVCQISKPIICNVSRICMGFLFLLYSAWMQLGILCNTAIAIFENIIVLCHCSFTVHSNTIWETYSWISTENDRSNIKVSLPLSAD